MAPRLILTSLFVILFRFCCYGMTLCAKFIIIIKSVPQLREPHAKFGAFVHHVTKILLSQLRLCLRTDAIAPP